MSTCIVTVFVMPSDEYGSALRNQVEGLATSLIILSQNGLFFVQSKVKYDECAQPLGEARLKLSQDFNYSVGKFMETSGKIDEAINAAPLRWRARHLYGIHIMLYLIACFLFLVYIYTWSASLSPSTIYVLWVPMWSPVLGALGSIGRSLWFLWYNVNRRRLRKDWLAWFLQAPVLGAIYGIIAYLAFLAGYIATTQSAEVKGEAFPMLLSVLAGFSWQWVNRTINRITKALGGPSEQIRP